MQRESVGGTFAVAATLCVVCSVLVSTAAVGLRPIQEANKSRFQKKNILIAAGIPIESGSIDEAFESVETRIIDLATGESVGRDVIDPDKFDQLSSARDPQLSVQIAPDKDIAAIKRREKYSRVYLVMDDGKLAKVVLPVYGKGLWSTLYGFIALEVDLNSVSGLTFYEHRETPGLGGEVDNPRWKAKWPGKSLRNAEGEFRLEVVKGQVAEGSPNEAHQVDGLSGATITSRGVSNLLRYWLSDDGFGPFLRRLQAEGQTNG